METGSTGQKPRVKRRTATKKHLAAMQRLREWMKKHRAQPLSKMLRTLKRLGRHVTVTG